MRPVTSSFHGFSDFDHQTRFDVELFSIRQAKVSKHVAATAVHFDTFHPLSFHLRNSLWIGHTAAAAATLDGVATYPCARGMPRRMPNKTQAKVSADNSMCPQKG